MTGHILAKLYEIAMEVELSCYIERVVLQALEQVGFGRDFFIIDHISTFRCLVNLIRDRKQSLYSFFHKFS